MKKQIQKPRCLLLNSQTLMRYAKMQNNVTLPIKLFIICRNSHCSLFKILFMLTHNGFIIFNKYFKFFQV